ncbi:UbiA family prenyltransferase [Streptomyces lacrimifluminis]|nr:UbiA family prenyltransferase [Streptomyces lacrimifluminis]
MELTVRMLGDNATAAIAPGILFTAVASHHYHLDATATAKNLAASALLFFFYLYVCDASNQISGVAEDQTNKPYRPIPAGMTTVQGMHRRLWGAMPVYTLLGWLTGTLPWVVLWQVIVVTLNLWSPPRYYFLAKPVVTFTGTVAQLAAAWSLVHPLDAVGWKWVIVIAATLNLPLSFEDVRDMDGDNRIGRRTLALIIGDRPVRIWFALSMAAVPPILHFFVYAPTSTSTFSLVMVDIALAALSWTTAIRALTIHTVKADRTTYLMYTYAYCLSLTAGLALL